MTAFAPTLLRAKAGADDGIRTRDLRFTKPLLYQLSYVGTRAANIASCQGPGNRTCDGRTLMLMIEINSRSFQASCGRALPSKDHGITKVSPISRSAMRSGVLRRTAWKRSMGSRNGSKLSRNV